MTSTYYYDDYPQWVKQWNQAKLADRYRGKTWELLHDRSTYLAGAALGTGVPLVAFLHLPPPGPVWTPARGARVVAAVLAAAVAAG